MQALFLGFVGGVAAVLASRVIGDLVTTAHSFYWRGAKV